MRIVSVTDLHGNVSVLARILAAEKDAGLVVLGGDLTHFGTPDDAEHIVGVACMARRDVLAVAGNCDSAPIDDLLADRGLSLHGRGVLRGEVGFFGVSGMPPWMGNMYEFTEEEIDAFLERGYQGVQDAQKLVLVSHPPPRGLVDRTRSGQHVGSTAVLEWIEKVQPALVLCGHIHEARGHETTGLSHVVNCGKAQDGYYAVATIGQSVQVELKQV